ncbi:pilus assembly protein CpaA [Paramagnetospirillum marisnigri]|uniref:Pilus assembly protein CpaA n=1 Tax=Paramagnetospirillum marisnigri TaxID=1285242 RepID=A0A178MQR7_9PROT|nr:prepilin peptidase [Paramagnetospirillum marisnigri]OAN50448.1 pilus assembly protein CpaA [Paramagnetospirillum marisnigri]
MTTLILVPSLAFVAALLDGAICDLRAFRIPNRVPLLLAASYALALAAGFDAASWPGHLGVGAAVFAVSVLLFSLGVWGGGDAKMLPAAVLWVGPGELPRFLLVMALVGGALALLALAARRVPLGPEGELRDWGRRLAISGQVPYGVAIACAGLDWGLANLLPRLMG